ncbi:hypothetical protein Tco_0864586, partial [Tanacetum coccineum]
RHRETVKVFLDIKENIDFTLQDDGKKDINVLNKYLTCGVPIYKLCKVNPNSSVVNEKCSKDVTLDKKLIQSSPFYFSDDDHSEDKVNNPSKVIEGGHKTKNDKIENH